MRISGAAHERLVLDRRARRLSDLLAETLPDAGRVLDVGCGDGRVGRRLMELRPGIEVTGVDVLVRPTTAIPVQAYDGRRLPFADGGCGTVMLVDVLHHTPDPATVLAEARRVSSELVVVKDHCRDGLLVGPTLRLMDWVGNERHGVDLPYNYWPRARWERACADLGLTVRSWRTRLDLYPAPLRPVFERKLHFLAMLAVR